MFTTNYASLSKIDLHIELGPNSATSSETETITLHVQMRPCLGSPGPVGRQGSTTAAFKREFQPSRLSSVEIQIQVPRGTPFHLTFVSLGLGQYNVIPLDVCIPTSRSVDVVLDFKSKDPTLAFSVILDSFLSSPQCRFPSI